MTCTGNDSAPTAGFGGHIQSDRTKHLRDKCCAARTKLAFALVCMMFGTGLETWAQNTIRIRGEDTMVYLAQQCSSLYRKEHGAGSPQFDIAGGGRASGVAALAFGRADITQVKSVLTSNLDSMGRRVVRLPIGIEFAVVYVNASNPVAELSLSELRAIFSGKITNWRQVGGFDAPVHLLAGENTTGLTDFFEHTVLQGETPAPVWGKSSPKELVDAVASDPFAIGYTGLRAQSGVKAIPIRRAKAGTAVKPEPLNLRNRSYPLTRFVYWYLPAKYRQEARNFAEWVFSAHGQLVIESVGYMPLLPQDRTASLAQLSLQLAQNTAH